MPPGASSYGDNRFSLLAENLSPQAKKKKRARGFLVDEFPQLQKTVSVDPKFVVVSSDSIDKPLSKFSCFAIYRSIKLISNDIISITELRDGSLLLLVKSNIIANKFLNTKEFAGLCKVKCTLHEKLNITKGTVYAPYLNDIEEEEITRELKSQGVVRVYKFTKNQDGKRVPNGVLLLDFDSYTLPSKIDISWHSVKVREYIPTPMRCKNCQLLGHTQKYCKNATSCVSCNLPPHSPLDCTRTYCANCAENHPSDYKECKKFLQQKQILIIKTQKKCSMRDAQKIYQQQQPPQNNSNSYSAVLSAQSQTSLSNTTSITTATPAGKNIITPSENPFMDTLSEIDIPTNNNISSSQTITQSSTPYILNNNKNDTSFNFDHEIDHYSHQSNNDSYNLSRNNSPLSHNTPNTPLSVTASLISQSILTSNDYFPDETV